MHYESRYGNKIAIKFFKQGQLRKYRTIGG